MISNLDEDVKYAKEIELFLVKKKFGNIHEIAKELGIHWVTAQKVMKKLEEIGRVHQENNVYFLNGVNKWQKRINLNSNHTLFIDTFKTPFGDNFVRIKETKKENGQWSSVGNVMITKDKIKEVREFLETIEKNITSSS